MPNINDVARAAGVSKATVSRVLNNKEIVSENTKEKVYAAIEKLQYQPNLIGRMLRTSETQKVLVLLPDIANSFFSTVIRGIGAQAQGRFYVTILISMPIGHWVRTIFGGVQVSFGYCFHSPTHCSGFFHASNLTFLLPRSAYIVSMFYGWIFTRIASSKVPFLTLLRSRSRFSGGSLV